LDTSVGVHELTVLVRQILKGCPVPFICAPDFRRRPADNFR
jgi:hypothetical protein